MADLKISQLTGATTPLAGTEVVPVVQSSTTKKVAVSDLTAGRAVSALSQTTTNDSSFNGINVGRGGGSVAGNTRAGANALLNNTTGANVTGVGANANRGNTTGSNNTAVGADAGYSQQGGSGNTLIGSDVGSQDTAFDQLTAVGFRAGKFNQGDNNTFVGAYAGYEVTTGSNNTVLGGYNGNQGGVDIRTSSGNVVLSDGVGNIRAYFDGTDWKIPTGNVIVGTAAKGVNFTANTPAAGMTSQLLNWYEEGTWTPSISSSSGTITTVSSVSGYYTRKGREVTLTGTFTITSNGTGAGVILIQGLPWSVANSLGAGTGNDGGLSSPAMKTIFAGSTTYLIMSNCTDSSYPVATGSVISFAFTYFV